MASAATRSNLPVDFDYSFLFLSSTTVVVHVEMNTRAQLDV